MFVFQFEGPLFRFMEKAPALDPLFQFPPRSPAAGSRSALHRSAPDRCLIRTVVA
jgi:hypothetical protein